MRTATRAIDAGCGLPLHYCRPALQLSGAVQEHFNRRGVRNFLRELPANCSLVAQSASLFHGTNP